MEIFDLPQPPPDYYEWASWHYDEKDPRYQKHGPLVMEMGRDKTLAQARLEVWTSRHPQVVTKILRRTVTYGPWEEVNLE